MRGRYHVGNGLVLEETVVSNKRSVALLWYGEQNPYDKTKEPQMRIVVALDELQRALDFVSR